MSGLNRIHLIGRTGRDAELTYTGNGNAALSFSLAVDGWGKNPKTTWFNCRMYGERAEKLAEYVIKGKQIYVEGRHESREYEKDGQKRTAWEVVAQDIQLLGDGGGQQRSSAGRSRKEDDYDDLPYE